MRPNLATEMVLLIASAIVVAIGAMYGSLQGMFNAGVMYFDTGYQPTFWELVIPAFFNGLCCSFCPTMPCLGVFVMLPVFGIQFDLIGRGFWKVFLAIWAVGYLNGAIFAALMMAILKSGPDSIADNVLWSLVITAGLATLLVDGTIIILRYRSLNPHTQINP